MFDHMAQDDDPTSQRLAAVAAELAALRSGIPCDATGSRGVGGRRDQRHSRDATTSRRSDKAVGEVGRNREHAGRAGHEIPPMARDCRNCPDRRIRAGTNRKQGPKRSTIARHSRAGAMNERTIYAIALVMSCLFLGAQFGIEIAERLATMP
jgi:hypothetical protein